MSASSSASAAKCGAELTCKSCSSSDNACLFSQTYGDGSACSGRVIKEKIAFDDQLTADAYIGLVDKANGGAGKPALFTNTTPHRLDFQLRRQEPDHAAYPGEQPP